MMHVVNEKRDNMEMNDKLYIISKWIELILGLINELEEFTQQEIAQYYRSEYVLTHTDSIGMRKDREAKQ